MEYLKEKQHYIDLYDLFTIKDCLEMIDICTKVYIDNAEKEEAQGLSKADRAKGSNWATNQQLYIIKASRYNRKEETIQKWMEKAAKEQEQYDKTPEPRNIRCPDCQKLMQVKIKDLEMLENPMRMSFLFGCSSCNKKRWIYEDGTEQEPTPMLCPKCKAEVEISVVKETKDKVVWKTTCSSCSFIETKTDDFTKSRAERKKREEEDKKLLEEYREQFCSEKEGKEAFEYIEAIKVGSEIFDEEFKKYDSLAYQKVSRLKKVSVMELEKLLNEIFEKEHYIKLLFNNPEIGQHVIVSFMVQDENSSRKEDTSISDLQKLIKNTLEGTNWRLMSDGLTYRLGYISGRLKGYEREDDLFEISGEKKEEKQSKSKIDYETRMKYEGHHVVQLARLAGEFKGVQNVRERRLKHEPDGFFLESEEGTYSCGICGEHTPGNRTWWNLDGVRCTDCQRNIKEGVISAEIHKNRDTWIKDWELSSEYEFNIHPSTVKKLKRQGLLHGRDLKREDGTVYFTAYLISENKEFLEKYPRKPKQRMIITDLLGNKVEI